jgi:hypothetical protein
LDGRNDGMDGCNVDKEISKHGVGRGISISIVPQRALNSFARLLEYTHSSIDRAGNSRGMAELA